MVGMDVDLNPTFSQVLNWFKVVSFGSIAGPLIFYLYIVAALKSLQFTKVVVK